jgi:hypothetical protein
MAETRTITCDYCRKSSPISDVKMVSLSPEKVVTLCSACRVKYKSSEKKTEPKKEDDGKKPYFCTRCRYKFKFNPKGFASLKCPYCGKSDKVIEYKVPSADELVKRADNFE